MLSESTLAPATRPTSTRLTTSLGMQVASVASREEDFVWKVGGILGVSIWLASAPRPPTHSRLPPVEISGIE